MDKYINAVLVKIDEDHVVIINGEEYLLLNQNEPEPEKAKAEKKVTKKAVKKKPTRRYNRTDELRSAIIEVLKAEGGLVLSQVETKVREKYNLNPPQSTVRSLLRRMRDDGVLELHGVKNGAKWSVKDKPIPPPPAITVKQTEPTEHVEF